MTDMFFIAKFKTKIRTLKFVRINLISQNKVALFLLTKATTFARVLSAPWVGDHKGDEP